MRDERRWRRTRTNPILLAAAALLLAPQWRLAAGEIVVRAFPSLTTLAPPSVGPYVPCDSVGEQFLCVTEDRCIDIDRQCDGERDCVDGADEEGCQERPEKEPCDPEFGFNCKNGDCISRMWLCDQDADCHDGSDESEEQCPKDKDPFKQVKPCVKDEFQCTNGLCVPNTWTCDGVDDCLDGGSDEKPEACQTKPCEEDQFNCGGNRTSTSCISKFWLCDGDADCEDGKDEAPETCSSKASVKDCDSRSGFFSCGEGKACIKPADVCDGTKHCDNGADEGDFCQANHCGSVGCSQECREGVDSDGKPTPTCYCKEGYRMGSNGTCQDVDECEQYGRCSQDCANTAGGFMCTCRMGYHMEITTGECKVFDGGVLLLYAEKAEIRARHLLNQPNGKRVLESIDIADKKHSHAPLKKTNSAVSIAFDDQTHNVYWSATEDNKAGIMFASLHDSSDPKYLIQSDQVLMPEGIAFDFLGRNIYFTDSVHKYVGVVSIRTKAFTRIISTSIEKPRSIALHPMKGLLFYTDWGSAAKLVRADMDGDNIKVIVTERVQWINGVAVDRVKDRVYFAEAKADALWSVDLDGNDRRAVLKGIVRHPFSIDVFEDTLYWSDWDSREISTCNKFTGKNHSVLVKTLDTYPMGVSVYHHVQTMHFTESPCEIGSNPCSHICLISPSQDYVCKCPQDMELHGKTTCGVKFIQAVPDSHNLASGNNDRIGVIGGRDMRIPENITHGPSSTEPTTRQTTKTTKLKTSIQATNDKTPIPPAGVPDKSTSTTVATTITTTTTSSTASSERADVERTTAFILSVESAQPEETEEASSAPARTRAASSDSLVIGIVLGILLVLILAFGIYCFLRRRRNKGVARDMSFRFRNPNFGRDARLSTAGAEELKNVAAYPSPSNDGTMNELHNPGFNPSLLHAKSNSDLRKKSLSGSYRGINEDVFNAADQMRRSLTSPDSLDGDNEKLSPTARRTFTMDSERSSSYAPGSTPAQSSSMEDDDDELDAISIDNYGDKTRLIP